MDLDVQLPTIAKEHTISNAEDTQPVLNVNEAAVEDGVAISEPGDVASPVGNAQDKDKPTDIVENSEQRTFDDIQAAGNLIATSESVEKQLSCDWQPPLMSETLPPQDVHPHPKAIGENVKPEGGEAVVAPSNTEDAQKTGEEMSDITTLESERMNVEGEEVSALPGIV
jgi:hypothetical protein